jgi:hypothetical protein
MSRKRKIDRKITLPEPETVFIKAKRRTVRMKAGDLRL